jgi:hypothetical protein
MLRSRQRERCEVCVRVDPERTRYRLRIETEPLVSSTGQVMARAEALLPHPAARPIANWQSEPWSEPKTRALHRGQGTVHGSRSFACCFFLCA